MSKKGSEPGTASAAVRSAARIGGLATSAKYDSRQTTKPARRAFEEKFEREALEADPSLADDPQELKRRAGALLRLHMARLNHASVQSKARAKARRSQ